MKKTVFIIVFMCLAIASSLSTSAQVPYTVGFNWDDSNCSCNDPVTMEARVVLYTYPTVSLVDDSGWFSMSGLQWSYDGEATGLRDCGDLNPCYSVYVYIQYKDNTGVCCSGSGSENTTGALLMGGQFSLSTTIILN